MNKTLFNAKGKASSRVIWLALLGLVVFFAWAKIAILDEVTVGSGKVTPSTRAQVIESLNGGVIDNLYVQQGNSVEKGQSLAQLEVVNGKANQLRRATLTSPVCGIVKDIQVTPVGGVLQPGGKLMKIVPLEDKLLIETRVNPRDIAYIRPGLPAIVKITAYDSSIYGDLNDEVESVSPDTLQDEVRRDHYYYRVYVRTLESGLTNKNGDPFAIVPGMMANVEIKTGQKSVLDYLIKPLNKMNEALRER